MKEQKAREFVSFARQVATEESTWADWHNRVFGTDGKFVELFPEESDRKEFIESAYQVQIEKIVEAIRDGMSIREYTVPVTTPSGRFVVRIPKSLHAALTCAAREEGVSLNQLVLTKLAIRLGAATRELLVSETHQHGERRIEGHAAGV